jgi:hypothetical protein
MAGPALADSPYAKVLQYAVLLEAGIVHAELGSTDERARVAGRMRDAVRKARDRSTALGTRRQQMAALFREGNELLDSGGSAAPFAAACIRECFSEREWKEALPWLFSTH